MLDIKLLLRRVDQIPTLPFIATQIMNIVSDPETSAKDLYNVISIDPPLATRILKIANSAYFGVRHKIANLNQAIVILGFSLVKSIALGITVFDSFEDALKDTSFRREDFWRHSSAVAFLNHQIAVKMEKIITPETAFSVGLLHDTGKLVLDYYAHEEFCNILSIAELKGVSFYEAEKILLQTNHAEIASWLYEQWDFTEEIVEGVRFHHTPEGAKKFAALAAICHCSSYTCNNRGIGYAGDVKAPPPAQAALDMLHLSTDELQKMLESVLLQLQITEIFRKE